MSVEQDYSMWKEKHDGQGLAVLWHGELKGGGLKMPRLMGIMRPNSCLWKGLVLRATKDCSGINLKQCLEWSSGLTVYGTAVYDSAFHGNISGFM